MTDYIRLKFIKSPRSLNHMRLKKFSKFKEVFENPYFESINDFKKKYSFKFFSSFLWVNIIFISIIMEKLLKLRYFYKQHE